MGTLASPGPLATAGAEASAAGRPGALVRLITGLREEGLLRIEEELGDSARYAGAAAVKAYKSSPERGGGSRLSD